MNSMMNRFLMMIALFCMGTATMTAEPNTYITEVINGTTLVTAEGDTVQLIGVRSWDSESMGDKHLQDYLEILVGGVLVTLVEDPMLQDNGALKHRYVKVGGTLVNQHLIAEGYASARIESEFSEKENFLTAMEAARSERIGRWAIEDQVADIAEQMLDNDMISEMVR